MSDDHVRPHYGIGTDFGSTNDQRRIVTPADAVALGSSYLVIGRPITQAQDPVAKCQQIIAEIAQSGVVT